MAQAEARAGHGARRGFALPRLGIRSGRKTAVGLVGVEARAAIRARR